MPPGSLYRRIFVSRLIEYDKNKARSNANEFCSPIFDIIRVAHLFGLYNEVKGMLFGNRYYSKGQWKDTVWKRAWEIERYYWNIRVSLFKSTKTINSVSDTGRLLAGIAPETATLRGNVQNSL